MHLHFCEICGLGRHHLQHVGSRANLARSYHGAYSAGGYPSGIPMGPAFRQPDQAQRNRSRLWAQLTRVLNTIPFRNVLAIAGDLNTCRCLGGHVGQGVITRKRTLDSELEGVLQAFDLCVLNTWGRSRAVSCATFLNGSVSTQIDYIITRRSVVDAQARRAAPLELNLSPWRLGPRHRPVRASIPIFGGWKLGRRGADNGPKYSIQHLRACARACNERWTEFVQQARVAAQALPGTPSVGEVNRCILPLCPRLFPPAKRQRKHAYQSVEVARAIADMWRSYRHMRQAR